MNLNNILESGLKLILKALIVDDELMFRVGVKSCIDWDELGFHIVGEAFDGKQAISMINDLKPDVVFTDIKMPVMDGLELTKHIVVNHPNITIVIFSGYNDFEYVRETLRLGAYDYLLKLSMKPNDLIDLLNRIREYLINKTNSLSNESILIDKINSNVYKLKEYFLKKLFFNGIESEDEFDSNLKTLGLRLCYNNNYILVVSIDDYYIKRDTIRDEILLKTTFINIANEIINKSLMGEVVEFENGIFICIINLNNCSGLNTKKILSQIVKDINNSTKRMLNIPISAGVSYRSGNAKEYFSLFNEATSALSYKFYGGKEYIGFYIPDKVYITSRTTLNYQYENRVQNAFETTNIKALNQVMDDIIAYINEQKDLHSSIVRRTFKEILFIANGIARKYKGDIAECIKYDLFKHIDKIETFSDMILWIKEVGNAIIQYILMLKKVLVRDEIIAVIDYVKNNLDKSVSLRQASQIAHMSEKYFCFIFKKDTGKNYIDYIYELKMDKAKEMLKDKNVDIKQVSLFLGIKDEGYFSRIFKKYVGTSPSNYRKDLKS